MRLSAVILFATAVVFATVSRSQTLIVLRDTGQTQEGLPVVAPHPGAAKYRQVLERGFSGRLLGLDQAVQRRLFREGKGPEPAPMYLVLTRRQGGFPRQGMVLGGRVLRGVRWVDLPESEDLTGMWGAMDQIFPHELSHVTMGRLMGDPSGQIPVQTHAIGVRTSPETAFEEGFGELAQIMAVDDADADAAT